MHQDAEICDALDAYKGVIYHQLYYILCVDEYTIMYTMSRLAKGGHVGGKQHQLVPSCASKDD